MTESIPVYFQRKSFADLVVGTSNQRAVSRAKFFLDYQEDALRAAFIHGAAGQGKTLLAAAMVTALVERRGSEVLWVQAPFLQISPTRLFACDVLVVDDFDFLHSDAPSDAAEQDAMFSAMSSVLIRGGRVIVTSDVPAALFKCVHSGLRDLVRSMFSIGIAYPNFWQRAALALRTAFGGVNALDSSKIWKIAASAKTPRQIEAAIYRDRAIAGFLS